MAEAEAYSLPAGGQKGTVANKAHVFDGIESVRIILLDDAKLFMSGAKLRHFFVCKKIKPQFFPFIEFILYAGARLKIRSSSLEGTINITILIGPKNNSYENFAKQKRVYKNLNSRRFRNDGHGPVGMFIGCEN